MTSNVNPTPEPEPRSGEVIPYQNEFSLLDSQQSMRETLDLIDDSLRQGTVQLLQLPRIKILKEGFFQVEGPDGATMETANFLTGILTAYRPARIYWGRAFTGAKEPPSCTSMDGLRGVGDPGGSCTAPCPYAKFGTAKDAAGNPAAGQACRELRQVLFLLPGQIFPHHLDVGPVSLQDFNKYTTNLPLFGRTPWWGAITKLTLEAGSTKSNIKVARLKLTTVKRLSKEQIALVSPYHQRMQDYLTPLTVDADRYEVSEDDASRNPDRVPF